MLKRVTKKVMVAALAVMMLFGMPTLDVGAGYEPIEEQAYEDVVPLTHVRILRNTRGYLRDNITGQFHSAINIPGGATVFVLATAGTRAQVSGGGIAHLRWIPIVDLGF